MSAYDDDDFIQKLLGQDASNQETMPAIQGGPPAVQEAPQGQKLLTDAFESATPVESEVSGVAAKSGLPQIAAEAAPELPYTADALGIDTLASGVTGAAEAVGGPLAMLYAALHGNETAPKEMDELGNELPASSPKHSDLFDRVSNNPKMKEMGEEPSGQYVRSLQGTDSANIPVESAEEKNAAKVYGNPQAVADARAVADKSGSKDYISNMLNKIYGNDLNDTALKNAQSQRDQNEANARIMMGANTISAALSRGAIKPQNEVAEGQLKDAGQPVQDILTRRQAQMQGLEAGIKASDFADKEKLRDPDSSISASYRALALDINPSLAKQPDFQNMSAEGVKALLPGIDAKAKMQFYNTQKQIMMQNQQEQKYNSAEQKYAAGIQQLYSQRGAAGRAAQVNQAAQKLQALANQYKDQNDIPPPLLHSAAADFATIMQNGGVPHEGEINAMLPPTLSSKASTLGSLFTASPTGAGMGKYMNMLNNTAQELAATSQKYATDKENIFTDQYKNSLRPDFYTAQKERIKGSMPQTKQTSQTFSPDVMNYAQQHGISPQKAQAIKDKRSSQ